MLVGADQTAAATLAGEVTKAGAVAHTRRIAWPRYVTTGLP
jgi:hypothetical protein